MINLKIVRLEMSEEGTFGLLLVNKKCFCCTMELPWKSNQPQISCIPEGEYKCDKFFSPTFNREIILLRDVPNRSYIEIHPANVISEIKGCIGLGFSYGNLFNKRAVLASSAAVTALMKLVGDEKEIELKIVECL